MKLVWLTVALSIALAAGGCGQKGPLYLPDKNAKVATAPAGGAAPATPAATPAPRPKPNGQDADSPQPPQPQQPPQSPSTPH